MATTTCELECEDWVRSHRLPRRFGQPFYSDRLRLESGGFFVFDAVSADRQIAASISTNGAGKLSKLRAQMLFLLMANVSRRLLVLTEPDMYERCVREQHKGRVPKSIELLHAPLQDRIRELTLPNATLLQLAQAHPPPASWLEEETNPFETGE